MLDMEVALCFGFFPCQVPNPEPPDVYYGEKIYILILYAVWVTHLQAANSHCKSSQPSLGLGQAEITA